jgi:predicted DNA-binding transcriptional regulator AlpA
MNLVPEAGNAPVSTPAIEQVDALLSTPDAAMHLGGFKPATLEQWRWHNRGPRFVKLGRCIRYRRSDLDLYINERIHGTAETLAA